MTEQNKSGGLNLGANKSTPAAAATGGTQTGANIKEDADKKLPEGETDGTVKVSGLTEEQINEQAKNPPPGVVQEDNIPSNDHGQADPRNNEISEFQESMRNIHPEIDMALNGDLAAARVRTDDDGKVIYTSHPIANYQAGDYRFTNGVLRLDPDKVADFEKFLDDLPLSERHKIKKVDIEAAENVSRKFQAQNSPQATNQTDSTIGERAGKAHTGTGDLADSPNGGAAPQN